MPFSRPRCSRRSNPTRVPCQQPASASRLQPLSAPRPSLPAAREKATSPPGARPTRPSLFAAHAKAPASPARTWPAPPCRPHESTCLPRRAQSAPPPSHKAPASPARAKTAPRMASCCDRFSPGCRKRNMPPGATFSDLGLCCAHLPGAHSSKRNPSTRVYLSPLLANFDSGKLRCATFARFSAARACPCRISTLHWQISAVVDVVHRPREETCRRALPLTWGNSEVPQAAPAISRAVSGKGVHNRPVSP